MKLEPIANTPPVTLAPRDDKARRRSNAAPSERLPFTAETLESGVTLETLLALPVPVFAYATQITIHGILADFQPGLVSTYKHLTRNQNGSLGVRWGAIDSGKKRLLRESIRWIRIDTDGKGTPWHATQNSKGTTVYREIPSIAEGRSIIAALPTGIYGSASLMRCIMSGTLYVDISIGAIAEENLWTVIPYFAPHYNSPEVLQYRNDQYARERRAEEERGRAERKVLRERAEARREMLRATAASMLIPLTSWKPGPGKFIRITEASSWETPSFTVITLERRGPNLCRINGEGKGKVLAKEGIAIYQKDSASGHLFQYDEARIPALKELLRSIPKDSPALPEHSPAQAVSALDHF